MYRSLDIVIVLLALAVPVRAQPPLSPAAETLEAFLGRLQSALLTDDRRAIADMIRYPITVSIGGLRVPFSSATALLERYDDIFNPALRASIARATVSQGSVIGTHDVEISEVNGQRRITSIRVPHYDDAATATVDSAGRPAGTATRKEPRRVAIRVGARPTQIPGMLGREGTDVLLLYLPKGRLAGIRLERVPPGAAVLRVVHARSGALLDARTSADGRYVSGRPSESADYRIEVRRKGNVDEGPLPYMLSLTLR
jgi:hypothetical protein